MKQRVNGRLAEASLVRIRMPQFLFICIILLQLNRQAILGYINALYEYISNSLHQKFVSISSVFIFSFSFGTAISKSLRPPSPKVSFSKILKPAC